MRCQLDNIEEVHLIGLDHYLRKSRKQEPLAIDLPHPYIRLALPLQPSQSQGTLATIYAAKTLLLSPTVPIASQTSFTRPIAMLLGFDVRGTTEIF